MSVRYSQDNRLFTQREYLILSVARKNHALKTFGSSLILFIFSFFKHTCDLCMFFVALSCYLSKYIVLV